MAPERPDDRDVRAGGEDRRLQEFTRLLGVIDRLRDPEGCPWDRDQSLESMAPCLLEEAYEVVDALLSGQRRAVAGELGDLLMNILLVARIAEDAGEFSLEQVAGSIADKLVRRHPHVFSSSEVAGVEGVLRNWEKIKQEERAGDDDRSTLAGVPAALPALLRAYRLGEKAARVGFTWPDIGGALAKLDEELGEFREALAKNDRQQSTEELGDVLFSVVNVARHAGIEPETALRRAAGRFSERFRYLEEHLDQPMDEVGLERLDQLWREAKRVAREQGVVPEHAGEEWREACRRLDLGRRVLLESMQDLPPDLVAIRPAGAVSAWSVAEVLEHVWRSETAVTAGLLRSVAARLESGEPAAFPPEGIVRRQGAVPERLGTERVEAPERTRPQGGVDREELLARLVRSRATLLSHLPQWVRWDPRELGMPHPALGQLDLLQWMRFLAEHELRHSDQILRIRKAFASAGG